MIVATLEDGAKAIETVRDPADPSGTLCAEDVAVRLDCEPERPLRVCTLYFVSAAGRTALASSPTPFEVRVSRDGSAPLATQQYARRRVPHNAQRAASTGRAPPQVPGYPNVACAGQIALAGDGGAMEEAVVTVVAASGPVEH
jgi:hypothetical protein